jgi:CubicO group peptidase (beta-lactamase class C family)
MGDRFFTRRRFIVAACSSAGFLSSMGHAAPAADSRSEKADAIVREAMRTHQIPGVCLGVIRNGHLEKATGYGYADVELKVRVTPQSLFQSGSVAKQLMRPRS